ncbi:unnamed protein product [Paramecium primaurelia]|uniref:Uncharacterized protein n=1 Tax=Paramecium primaurelia TaxID=5886 RepID=A0A8S1PQE0_PARPR|nr:unnamed protein product [Paramecium primaurelia]
MRQKSFNEIEPRQEEEKSIGNNSKSNIKDQQDVLQEIERESRILKKVCIQKQDNTSINVNVAEKLGNKAQQRQEQENLTIKLKQPNQKYQTKQQVINQINYLKNYVTSLVTDYKLIPNEVNNEEQVIYENTLIQLFRYIYKKNKNELSEELLLKFNTEFKNNLYYSIEILITLAYKTQLKEALQILKQELEKVSLIRNTKLEQKLLYQLKMDNENFGNFSFQLIDDLIRLEYKYLSFVIFMTAFGGVLLEEITRLSREQLSFDKDYLICDFKKRRPLKLQIERCWIPQKLYEFMLELSKGDFDHIQMEDYHQAVRIINFQKQNAFNIIISNTKNDEYKAYLSELNFTKLLFYSNEFFILKRNGILKEQLLQLHQNIPDEEIAKMKQHRLI